MARTKGSRIARPKPLITWTRFYLPREQEWPMWDVDDDKVHLGPLLEVDDSWLRASLGRMMDDPEQAVYIIEWTTAEDLKKFLSSAACADFLRNLPEHNPNISQVPSVKSGSQLVHLTLDDTSPWSAPAASSSRFLALKHLDAANITPVEGIVTLTTLMVPYTVDDPHAMWKNELKSAFDGFMPKGSGFLAAKPLFWHRLAATWFQVLSEDGWAGEKFGGPEQGHEIEGGGHDQERHQGRSLFCRFHLWTKIGATPEHEAASAADLHARESWDKVIARAMPPATAFQQERWDIREVPRFFPPEPEYASDPEERAYEEEQKKLLKEYLEFHGFRVVGGGSE